MEIHLLQVQQKKASTLKFVLNAIHSTQDSRNLLELTDVSISSIRNMAFSKSNVVTDKVEVIKSQPFLHVGNTLLENIV